MNEENDERVDIGTGPEVPITTPILDTPPESGVPNINTGTVVDPTQNMSANQEPLPKSVMIALVIGWVLYLPPAFWLFKLTLVGSLMSSAARGSLLYLLQGMSINLIPFSFMAIFTYIAIKKKSLMLAIATPILTLVICTSMYKTFKYIMYTRPAAIEFARKKAVVITPEENRFVCSQDLYIETFKNPAILVERKLTGKIGDYEFTPAIGNIENNEIKVLDYFATNKERARTLDECKNSEGKTFSEKYKVVIPADEKKAKEEQLQRDTETK